MSLFGGLASAIKSKVAEVNEVKIMLEKAEARCAAEAKTYEKSVEETKAQQKLLSFLLSNVFEQYETSQSPSLGDWKHLSQHTEIRAAKKYSLLTWSEYSFYTYDGVYYHNKKKGVHAFLYYDGINDFDAQTCDVDYGKLHEKRSITDWQSFDKKIIELISDIHRDTESANATILAFCFNECSDFRNALQYYKSNEISKGFDMKVRINGGLSYWYSLFTTLMSKDEFAAMMIVMGYLNLVLDTNCPLIAAPYAQRYAWIGEIMSDAEREEVWEAAESTGLIAQG